MAELAALEMLCTGNCTVGSNPTLSATRRKKKAESRRQKGETSEISKAKVVLLSAYCLLPSDLSGSGRRAIARLQTPPGRERSNGSGPRMCRGLSGA